MFFVVADLKNPSRHITEKLEHIFEWRELWTRFTPNARREWFDRRVHVEIRRLTKAEFSLLAPRLVDIYIEAMGYSPAMRAQRLRVWRTEVVWPGFAAVIAVAENQVMGVAYGFLGARERWWDKQLIKALRQQRALTEADQAMIRNYFEVAEVHVDPRLQGHGIGASLLRALLDTTTARWAILSTPEVDGEANNAFGLYRKFGFTDVARGYRYDGDPRPFAILALDLAGSPATASAD